jgi:hypothetical protein
MKESSLKVNGMAEAKLLSQIPQFKKVSGWKIQNSEIKAFIISYNFKLIKYI